LATQNLIPKAGKWLDLDLNVMLIGLHGVGKTQVVLDLCKEKGLKMKYFSCATLDPYTDLVGVPVPREDGEGAEYLKMVRPREVDEAEIIFMDEFNRADPKVHNALMEIILFRTINGEPLPNLRMIWAAMNPPGQEYDVEDLDPALLDRFDVYEDVAARPSPEYLAEQGIRLPVAKALCAWWQEQNKNRREQSEMITPRRLEKMGKLYERTGDFKPAIPNWFNVDRGKLRQMLQDVEAKDKATKKDESGKAIGKGPAKQFEYNPEYFKNEAFAVAQYLTSNPDDLETHKAAVNVVQNRHANRIVRDYGEIVDALKPAMLEALLADMAEGKFTRLVTEVENVEDWRKAKLTNFAKAVEQEKSNRS
jgi:hypothetical protein